MQGDVLQSHQQTAVKANPSSFALMASAALPSNKLTTD